MRTYQEKKSIEQAIINAKKVVDAAKATSKSLRG